MGPEDEDALYRILEPVFRAGETYPLPTDIPREEALLYWCAPGHQVWVAEEHGAVVGTYYLRANQKGGGAHVANCGYATAESARRRGIVRVLGEHSLVTAKAEGFEAMQFNFVVSANETAVRLWTALGFEVVGRVPLAFDHPTRGRVDALVMYRSL